MYLHELLPQADLEAAIEAGHVKRRDHPTEPLAILNYTQCCMFARAWSHVTRACRGLIYRTDTLEIVARPFAKFFNYGEPEAGELDLQAPCFVSDKVDGSLGILYPLPVAGGYAIATRGSFVSPQAVRATAMWNALFGHWANAFTWHRETYLYEIVYPENRIVLNYGERAELVHLAIVDIETGRDLAAGLLPGTEQTTLAEVLARPPRANAEGFVAYFSGTGQRVKIKQADYVALHRLMTNMSARRIWEFLAVHACKSHVPTEKMWAKMLGLDPARAVEILAACDNWLEAMLDGVPDEFFGWVRGEVAKLQSAVDRLSSEIAAEWGRTAHRCHDRKSFAAAVAEHPHKPALFAMLEPRRETVTYLWRTVRPEAGSGWLNRSEDEA